MSFDTQQRACGLEGRNPVVAVRGIWLSYRDKGRRPRARKRHASGATVNLEVMSQRDMRDPWWLPAPLRGPSLAKPIEVRGKAHS
jgi:hypothetical protein